MGRIRIPAYEFAITSAIINFFVAVYLTVVVLRSSIMHFFIEIIKGYIIAFITAIIVFHYIISVLMFLSAIMIKHEDHYLAGSIIALVVSIIGFFIGAGFIIGPAIGLTGGILGLKEHRHLILHKKEIHEDSIMMLKKQKNNL
jgi:hypothetical protein